MSLLLTGAGLHVAVASGADPYFANVVFLAGWEGTDGATSYNEEKNGRAATFVGNAQLDDAQKKFGSTSLRLDGTGDRVTFADNADWDLANANSDPYTVECWVRFNTLTSANRGIMAQNGSIGGSTAWIMSGTSSPGEVFFASSHDGSTLVGPTTSGASLTTGVWYAFAADHDATGKIRFYVDGVMRGSDTPANSTILNSIAALVFGAQGEGGAVDMDGWIDEVRITKGVARYASDSGYTPSATAFPRF